MTTAFDPRHLKSADYDRLYPSASAAALLPRAWDITITGAGAEGDVWSLVFNGQTVQFTNLAAPTTSTAAAGLRSAAGAMVGVTVGGATTHVILTVPAPNEVSDEVPSAPVLTVAPAGGTSTQAVVTASSFSGFGKTAVDQK